MNKFYLFKQSIVLVTLLISSFFSFAQVNDQWYSDNQRAIDSIRKGDFIIQVRDADSNLVEADVTYSLKKHEFPWGTALASSNLETDYWYAATARKFFNSGVTENAFKWSLMQPSAGPVNYNDVNQYVDWCNKVGWSFRGHTLLWGSQNYNDFHPLMKWVKDLPWPDMNDTLKVRVQRETNYYKGIIKEYDVMNEATPGHADWLQRTYGDSINWNAFKWARETDPDAKLFINDYSIISSSDYGKYIKMIANMLENGAPIDGIGVQGHFSSSLNPGSIKYILDSLATFGLPIKVTEFDMDVGKYNMSEENQAKYYALAMRTCFAHPSISGFMFWGFWDSRHWRDEAGIFTTGKSPKMAADSVYNLIHTTWSTQGHQTVSSTIPLEVNGYYGDYELEVNVKGEKSIIDLALNKSNTGDTIRVSLANSRLVAPKLMEAIAYAENQITLKFDSNVRTDGTEINEFKINTSADHSISKLWQPVDDSTQIILELAKTVNYRHYITASYFPGTIIGENGAPLEFMGSYEVLNLVPGFLAGKTSFAGDSIYLDFSEEILQPDATDFALFNITADDVVIPLAEIGVMENQKERIFLKTSTAIEFGQRIIVTYTPGEIKTVKGGFLPAFGPKLIGNKVGVGVDDNFDKNNVLAYYNKQNQNIVISNQSSNNHDYYYHIYTVTGQQIKSGQINSGQKISINASVLKSGLTIVRFESINRKVNSATKIIIDKF